MIDFMFALSTLTNQAEVLKSTQKSALKGQLEEDVSFGSIAIGQYISSLIKNPEYNCELNLDVKDEMLESMNEKADDMRKRIVDILGEDIGMD